MKTMKYLLIVALALGFSTTIKAQDYKPDGTTADIPAIKKLISSKPDNLEKLLKPFYSKNKKNADNLVAFARAFYEAKDTANAKLYANYALAASKNKCAPAFLLLGDIEALGDNGGGAAAQYEQAIYSDPRDPVAYYKYALVYRKIDKRGAMEKLEELRSIRPDIDVDGMKGHICAISKDDQAAYEAYSKADIAKLDRTYLTEYASACFFTGKHTDGLRVVNEAARRFPRYATFNRLGMMFNVELKNYQDALTFADRLFNASDSVKVHNQEYYYQGLAFSGLQQYDKAIESYNKALSIKSDGNLVDPVRITKSISDTYRLKGDFEQAAKFYRDYLAQKQNPTFDDNEEMAKIFMQQAKDSTLTDAAKEAILAKADAVYEELGNRFPNNLRYILYRRASIGNQLDPDLSKGAAKPHYEKLIEMLEPKTDRDAGDTQILGTAYHYMMAYSLHISKDVPKAKEFASKLLAINPEHQQAKAVSELK